MRRGEILVRRGRGGEIKADREVLNEIDEI